MAPLTDAVEDSLNKIYLKDWRKMRVAVIDTETTGLNAKENNIVEIGIIYFEDGKPVDKYVKTFNPNFKMNPKAEAAHGIKLEDLEDSPKFNDVAIKIKKRLIDCDIWCMFNDRFDRHFISQEFERAGVKLKHRMTIDPLIIANYIWPTGPNNLDSVIQRLRIRPDPDDLGKFELNGARHRADYDAFLTGMV